MPDGESGDQILVQRFRDGDESALKSLIARHEPRLRGILGQRLPVAMRRKLSVEDILQETYLTAYTRIPEFEDRHDRGFGAWLEQIAVFKLREQIRRYRNTAKRGAAEEVSRGARPDTVLFAGKGPSPSEAAIGEELRTRAIRAMRELPEDYRQVCRGARIVLGRDWNDSCEWYFSNRTWFTLGCGGFLLSNYVPGLEQIFENHRELVWYRSAQECFELIEHYLARPEERRRIAEAGRAFALAHRTYDHFARDLIDLVEGKPPAFPPLRAS